MDGRKAIRPAFIKFFLPAFSEKQMELPPGFTKLILNEISKEVVLRDPFNNLWQVKIKRVHDKLYFQDGWVTFVEDNSVEEGDMLVFEYISPNIFNVTFFGQSGCEKNEVGKYKDRGSEEQLKEETENDDYMYNIDEDDEEDNVREQAKSGTNDGAGTSEKLIPRKRISDIYGVEFLKYYDIPIPRNPYFLTRVKKREDELYIPKKIMKNNGIKLSKKITFVDHDGQTYKSEYREWNDGRAFYVGGWGLLCKRKSVGANDICLCEFVEVDGEPHIYVSILRFD